MIVYLTTREIINLGGIAMRSKSPKLKISFITNEEINKGIEKLLPRMIAESIYNKPEFQILLKKALNPSDI